MHMKEGRWIGCTWSILKLHMILFSEAANPFHFAREFWLKLYESSIFELQDFVSIFFSNSLFQILERAKVKTLHFSSRCVKTLTYLRCTGVFKKIDTKFCCHIFIAQGCAKIFWIKINCEGLWTHRIDIGPKIYTLVFAFSEHAKWKQSFSFLIF